MYIYILWRYSIHQDYSDSAWRAFLSEREAMEFVVIAESRETRRPLTYAVVSKYKEQQLQELYVEIARRNYLSLESQLVHSSVMEALASRSRTSA